MSTPEYKVVTTHNKQTGTLMSVYFQIRLGKAAEVREIGEGVAFANYDNKGRLLGVELLGPCRVQILARVADRESPKIKDQIVHFIEDSIPKKMALSR